MNKNCNWLDPRKEINILKAISNPFIICYFEYIDSKVCDALHLVMKTISNFFFSTFCWCRKYLNIFYIPFNFYYCQLVLFPLEIYSLLSRLNDVFIDIIDDKCSFQFSPDAEFTSPLYVHITFATHK